MVIIEDKHPNPLEIILFISPTIKPNKSQPPEQRAPKIVVTIGINL